MPTTPWQTNDDFMAQARAAQAQREAAAAAAAPAAGAAGTPVATPPPPPPQNGILGQPPGPGGGASPLGNWNHWMFSGGTDPSQWMNTGGVNANGWQQMGGGPDLSFLGNFQNMLSGGANPTQVAPTDAAGMAAATQPYVDTAYQQATRELDPQWDQAQKQFDQQMVSQGLAPGSAAYQQAYDNFNRSKTDAYGAAQAAAQQQGLAAQGQAFGQGLSQSQLAAGLTQALLGSQTGIANQQLGGNASVTNALLGGNQNLMAALLGGNSGIAQQLIGGQATRDSANASAGASRYASGLNHDIQQQNIDNGLLMQMLGMGNGMTQYNNTLPGMTLQNNMPWMNYMPNGAGAGNIDVQNPYNNQYQGQMNNWNYQNQQADAQNQQYMQMLMAGMGYAFGG